MEKILYLPLEIENNFDEIKNFVETFLIKALEDSHWALEPDINPDKDLIYSTMSLMSLYDKNGLSLLMFAVKDSNLNIVNYLIENGLNVNHRTNDFIAADFADQNDKNYSEIVLNLLKENSPFPRNFDEKYAKGELLEFLSDMKTLIKAVKNNNDQNALSIVTKYSCLKFYFVPDQNRKYKNVSAKRIAEESNADKILKLFDGKNIVKARFEIMNPERNQVVAVRRESSFIRFIRNYFMRN
jgi:hypothetical protein